MYAGCKILRQDNSQRKTRAPAFFRNSQSRSEARMPAYQHRCPDGNPARLGLKDNSLPSLLLPFSHQLVLPTLLSKSNRTSFNFSENAPQGSCSQSLALPAL